MTGIIQSIRDASWQAGHVLGCRAGTNKGRIRAELAYRKPDHIPQRVWAALSQNELPQATWRLWLLRKLAPMSFSFGWLGGFKLGELAVKQGLIAEYGDLDQSPPEKAQIAVGGRSSWIHKSHIPEEVQ